LPVATALGFEVRTDPGLRERNYGILEGKTFEEILELHPEEAEQILSRDARHRFPEGESQEEFSARALATLERIARAEDVQSDGRERVVLVVTHGGVLDMLYRSAFGIALDAQRVCPTPNAAINRVVFEDGRFFVREWATIP
jgi:probable phosphoglycerate mutase